MYTIEKFANLPKHQSLLDRAVKVYTEDPRVIGLYVHGSQDADEYSDIDISLFFRNWEDILSYVKEVAEITQRIGDIKAETWYGDMYLAIFDPEEIQIDIDFVVIYKDGNPYEYPVDILYDPEGHLEKMVKSAPKLTVEIDKKDLENRIKETYLGLNFTCKKIYRGSFWAVFHVLDLYRRGMVYFEDTFAQRKLRDYRYVEKNLDEERLAVLNKTLITELTRENLFKAMDAFFEYIDRFLKAKFQELGIFPEEYAKNMLEYYERKKKEILGL